MISYDQAMNGVMRFVDNEMVPHTQGFKKVALGTYVALSAKNAKEKLYEARSNPLVSVTGLLSDEGINIDLLYSELMGRIGESLQLDIPMIGVFKLTKADVEKLYNYMRGAI